METAGDVELGVGLVGSIDTHFRFQAYKKFFCTSLTSTSTLLLYLVQIPDCALGTRL